MLLSLKSLWRKRGPKRDSGQLSLELDAVRPLRDADELLAHLRTLGLKRIARCRLTRNRNVMVSFRGDELRVHEGYLSASSDVLEAIVAFIEGRTRKIRHDARRRIVSHAVETPR